VKQAVAALAWPVLAGLLLALLILERGRPLPAPLPAPITSYAAAVREASPSVVNIYTSKVVRSQDSPWLRDPFFRNLFPPERRQREQVERSLGSGVIMSAEGYVVTNAHVIAGADEILVLLHDGRDALAQVVGSDPETDLAILRIEMPDIEAIKLAELERAQVGDVVLAIGNPLGFGHSVSQGIISALGRYGLDASTYEDYIQTDATINPGNSGGALVNTDGQLLGINTLIFTPNGASIGIGLAIPAHQALFVMRDLIAFGKVIRGWLGVSVQPLRSREPGQDLALGIIGVARDSPAWNAGIRAGDVITHINGDRVADPRTTMHRIALLRPGDAIDITLDRESGRLDLNVIIGTRPIS